MRCNAIRRLPDRHSESASSLPVSCKFFLLVDAGNSGQMQIERDAAMLHVYLGNRLPAQKLHGLVVHNDAIVADDAIVAVRRVWVQRHVCVHLQGARF